MSRNRKKHNCQTFFLCKNFFEHIFEHIEGPLSGLFWRTKKCRSVEIIGGAYSNRLANLNLGADLPRSNLFKCLFVIYCPVILMLNLVYCILGANIIS